MRKSITLKNRFPAILLFLTSLSCACAISAQTAGQTDTLAAIRSLHQYISKISEQSAKNSDTWIVSFDEAHASELMKFTENNEEHYVVLAELGSNQQIDYDKHAKLFFLINDASVLKTLLAARQQRDAPDLEPAIRNYRFRVSLNSTLLMHYLISLEENMDKKTMEDLLEGNTDEAKEIYQKNRERYVAHLRNLAEKSDYFRQQLQILLDNKTLPDLPRVPLAIGMLIDEQTDLLHIYMAKDMGEQLRSWLASQQAEALKESGNSGNE